MDEGLKYWRSILPAQVTHVGASAGKMRDRIDRFTQQLVDSGHAPERAQSIAIDCARTEDRRSKR